MPGLGCCGQPSPAVIKNQVHRRDTTCSNMVDWDCSANSVPCSEPPKKFRRLCYHWQWAGHYGLVISLYVSSICSPRLHARETPDFLPMPKATRLLAATTKDPPPVSPLTESATERKSSSNCQPRCNPTDRPNARLALEATRKCDIVPFACHSESVARNPH